MHRFYCFLLAPNVISLDLMQVLQIVDTFLLNHDDRGEVALCLVSGLVDSHICVNDLHSGHPVQWDQLLTREDADFVFAEDLLRLCIALFESVQSLLLIEYSGHSELLLSKSALELLKLFPFNFKFRFKRTPPSVTRQGFPAVHITSIRTIPLASVFDIDLTVMRGLARALHVLYI